MSKIGFGYFITQSITESKDFKYKKIELVTPFKFTNINSLDKIVNYKHSMIEFFSTFNIENDGYYYKFKNLEEYTSLSDVKFNNTFIHIENNYLLVSNDYSKQKIIIYTINEFIEKFPNAYNYHFIN